MAAMRLRNIGFQNAHSSSCDPALARFLSLFLMKAAAVTFVVGLLDLLVDKKVIPGKIFEPV